MRPLDSTTAIQLCLLRLQIFTTLTSTCMAPMPGCSHEAEKRSKSIFFYSLLDVPHPQEKALELVRLKHRSVI